MGAGRVLSASDAEGLSGCLYEVGSRVLARVDSACTCFDDVVVPHGLAAAVGGQDPGLFRSGHDWGRDVGVCLGLIACGYPAFSLGDSLGGPWAQQLFLSGLVRPGTSADVSDFVDARVPSWVSLVVCFSRFPNGDPAHWDFLTMLPYGRLILASVRGQLGRIRDEFLAGLPDSARFYDLLDACPDLPVATVLELYEMGL